MTVPTPTSSTHAAGSAGAGRGKGTHAASAPRRLRRRSATSRPKWPMSGSVGTRRSSVRSPRLTMPPHWSRGNEHGQLDLGSIADRVDVGNPRDRCGVHGLGAASASASTGKAHSPLPACVRDRHHRDHDAGTALHATEAAIWAAAYLWLGALGSPAAAILYSVDSMATRGASGVTLQPHWQMLGALEAADGMLLFGISTAFIFTVMQYYFRDLRLMGD
jgi:hypothetical protein